MGAQETFCTLILLFQELFASDDPNGLLDEATLFLEALNNNPTKMVTINYFKVCLRKK